MALTHFSGVSVGDDGIEMTGSGTLRVPSLATAPSSPTVGDTYYDTTLDRYRVYQDSGWANVDGTAAASLDAAYNGGATITVDGGAVTLTDTQTTTGGGLLITKSGVVTGANSASVFHINSTGAHDTSGALKMLEISVGTETVSGGIYGIEIAMNANSDSAIEVTKGAVVLADGALTLTSGALTLTSGNLTMSSGNLDITGTAAISSTLAVTGAQTNQGQFILDVDNAEAFLVRENGDAADVFVIDTTQDAGDTTAKIESKTTTGIALHVDSDTTTGSAVLIDGDAITTGDALLISVASGTMGATGAAISVIDSSNSDREVFAVRDDGSVYMYGTAEGTTATQTVKGDMVITDGDLTLSGGEVSITDGVTTAGSGVLITSSMTTAGAAAGAAGALTIIAASATTGTVLAVTADALTSGDMLYLDNGGGTLNGGFYINCNDDNTSHFTVGAAGATVITGSAAGTDAFTVTKGDILLNDSDQNIIESEDGTATTLLIDNKAGVIASDSAVLSLDAGGAVASGGNILRIAPTGSPNAGAIGIEFVGASKAMTALYIDADPTGSDVATIHGGGALTSDNAVLTVSSDGALATGSNTFRVDTTGTPASGAIYAEFDFAGITDTNENIGVKIDAGGKKVVGLHVDADPEANSAVYFTSGAALAADKATLEVVAVPAGNDADSSVLRLEQTSTTGAGIVATMVQKDVSEPFINFECTEGSGNSVDSTHDTEGTTIQGFIRVAINGSDAYLTLYDTPTTAG